MSELFTDELKDNYYMSLALAKAREAYELDEVPIGCVIEYNGHVIGRGLNRRMTDGNVLAHAEIIAINEACAYMGDWRLEDCTLYVTVEPCPMCSGAILQARIPRLVYGTRNVKAGCCGSIYNLLDESRFNHRAEITEGVMADECSRLMKNFFRYNRRK
jgi:tRNA(adenine34) deaminase